MPFCHHFGGRGEVAEVDGEFILPDHDPFRNVFNDFPLFLGGKALPPAGEVPGLAQDFVAGKVLDPEEVHLPLETRDLVLQLLEPPLKGLVLPPEALGGDLVPDIEAVDLVYLGLNLLKTVPTKTVSTVPLTASGVPSWGRFFCRGSRGAREDPPH